MAETENKKAVVETSSEKARTLAEKEWEELGIENDFMFGKIMRKAELCQELLEAIFPEMEIGHIEYPEVQKSIAEDRDARAIRLDVYVRSGTETVFSIEMQVLNRGNLERRSRYYQSLIDLQLLDKSVDYKKLNDSYVIFICPFDLFGTGRHKYTFKNFCAEEPKLELGDGTGKIFLNAKGTQEDVSGNLKAFLDYVAGKKSENDFVKRLEEEVRQARKNREWRHEYMTLRIRDLENRELGREEGIKIGEEKGRAEGRVEGRVEGRAEGIFRSLDNLLRNNPTVGVDAGAAMLGVGAKELTEYKKARGLEPVGV